MIIMKWCNNDNDNDNDVIMCNINEYNDNE